MEPEDLWIRQAAGTHPLMRERQWRSVLGWGLLVTSVGVGFLFGVILIAFGDGRITNFPEVLLVPFTIPVAASLVLRKNVFLGVAGGIFAALTSFLVAGLWMMLMLACFVITFMGECP
jgi:hypothetical protein